MATDPNYRDPNATTTVHTTDPAARDTTYREPRVTEEESSGGIGKWVLIALAALAVALLVSFFIGGDDATVEEATIIEEPVVDDAVVVDADPVAPVEDDANIEVVTTDDPIAPEATETVPLGEPVQADGNAVIETDAIETETATAPATDDAIIVEDAGTETATTPLATEATGTDATETGSIEATDTDAAVTVLPADGAETSDVEFQTVPVQ